MNILFKFLKGICIGIANVIPGFSGATMAIITNIYDEFVGAFADIIHHPVTVIKKSWALFLGLVAGVVIALFSVVKLLEVAPLPTILFFVGLIIGSIPNLGKKVILKPFKISYLMTFISTIALIVGLPFVSQSNIGSIELNFMVIIILFLMGVISASAMVIPGVSGSMVLMIFGYYGYIMGAIEDFLGYALSFDFSNIWETFFILLAFVIGVIVGVVGISKLIKLIYNKFANLFNIGVLGLLLASPFAILYASNSQYLNMFKADWYLWLIGIVVLIGGFLFSYLSSKIENKALH